MVGAEQFCWVSQQIWSIKMHPTWWWWWLERLAQVQTIYIISVLGLSCTES